MTTKILYAAMFVMLLAAGSVQAGGDAARGAELAADCAGCHGVAGDGNGPAAAHLDPKPRDFTKGDFKYGGTDQDIFDVISNGAASKGGSALMAPWGAVISEEDRWALVKYIRTLVK